MPAVVWFCFSFHLSRAVIWAQFVVGGAEGWQGSEITLQRQLRCEELSIMTSFSEGVFPGAISLALFLFNRQNHSFWATEGSWLRFWIWGVFLI